MSDPATESGVMYQEWLDDRHPLLEEFRHRAGASLKHCQNVAHLCDVVAANASGVNRARLKIAATYHDVGKILNPNYFAENQNGSNPHDDLDPWVSFQLISRHVSDSAALLVQHRFPHEIIDVVMQHHGSTVMGYFYTVACEGEREVDDADFRYPWPSPTTPEAAILMICDVIEAKARADHDKGKLPPDLEGRQDFVRVVIAGLEDDGQFDSIPVGILRVAREVIAPELGTMFHTRVDYDEAKGKGRKKGPKPKVEDAE